MYSSWRELGGTFADTHCAPFMMWQERPVLTDGDWAVVELRSYAFAKSGMRFDNRYCWVVRFDGETIVEVRAYLDSALVQQLIDENEAHA